MKYLIILFSTAAFFISCVQKTYKKTVVLELNTAGVQNINTVGVRGNDKPLNWDKDFEMTAVKKDSLYTVSFTGFTGYKFTEIKFVINGEFELKEEKNRRIIFADGDTTVYKATFNKK
jgi:hypothetical protein